MNKSRELLPFRKQALPPFPCIRSCFFVGIVRVRRFARAHEAVSCAIVGHRLERFPRGLHVGDGIRNHRANSGVIARKESVHRSFDARHRVFLRRRAVENKRCRQVAAIRRETERLPASPAKSHNEQLPVRRGNFVRIIRRRIQVRGHLVWIQLAHRFHRLSLRKRRTPPAVGTHSRKQVWRNSNVTGCSNLIRQILHPIRHPEDFVNDQHHGPFVLRLRIHDESLHRPSIMRHGYPLLVPRRLCQLLLRPILRGNRLCHSQNHQAQQDALHFSPLPLFWKRLHHICSRCGASIPCTSKAMQCRCLPKLRWRQVLGIGPQLKAESAVLGWLLKFLLRGRPVSKRLCPCLQSFGGDMTQLRSLFLLLALCALVPALALPPQTPAPPKTAAPPATTEAKPSVATPAPAAHALEKSDLAAFFDGLIPLQMERSDVVGATVLVMKDGQELLKKGYGFSDVTKKSPVDPDSTMFRLASISKLFTWVSVMQLAEQGKLDIDADVNKYLDFQIAPAFGKPITLRNLMTHTGGFEEVVRNIILVDPKKSASLRDFLIANQPHRMYPAGEIPAYSNYGVGLAGYIVQRVSAEPFEQYVSEHIFLPLGMKHSSFNEPLPADLVSYASDGYRANTEKPAIGFEIFQPAPAGGISSSAADMGRFAMALLNGGELDGQRILKPETRDLMWTPQFRTSDSLPPACMGFYQTWRNNLHFIGHGGDLIAFHSIFLMEPREKLVLFISYNSAGSAARERPELLNAFADRYYPAYTPPAFQNIPLNQLKDIEGTYESTRRADSTKLAIGNPFGQSVARVDKDGVLILDTAKDLRGHTRKWRPIGKDLWQSEGDQVRVFAIRDAAGKVVRLATNFAGAQLERVPWYEKKNFVSGWLAFSVTTLLFVVLASLVRFGRRLIFRHRAQWRPQPGTLWITVGPRLAAFTWIIVGIWCLLLARNLQNDALPSFHRIERYFWLINWFSVLAVLFSVSAVIAAVRIWSREEVRAITRVKFSLVGLACLFLIWYAIHWNLIGPIHRF